MIIQPCSPRSPPINPEPSTEQNRWECSQTKDAFRFDANSEDLHRFDGYRTTPNSENFVNNNVLF
ncbi:hypothetical protein PN441_09000 [Spirulina major CS-329]|uniref:hypothetical protein n=1 Tax=Spirulina major TaxID=270636 RepID=UPI00232F5317|nr:hypothetical protein [Spirulina major]MDB9496733.1 hypothetical protein [Spirulina subsalsa CS-330]MDB9503208.1 hypothetical protein [Spirulina major CS-329]